MKSITKFLKIIHPQPPTSSVSGGLSVIKITIEITVAKAAKTRITAIIVFLLILKDFFASEIFKLTKIKY